MTLIANQNQSLQISPYHYSGCGAYLVKLAEIIHGVMRGLDEAMNVTNENIKQLKNDDYARLAYEDYRKQIREIGVSIYTLIGKMRMDRVLDPKELEELYKMGTLGIRIAEEPLE